MRQQLRAVLPQFRSQEACFSWVLDWWDSHCGVGVRSLGVSRSERLNLPARTRPMDLIGCVQRRFNKPVRVWLWSLEWGSVTLSVVHVRQAYARAPFPF